MNLTTLLLAGTLLTHASLQLRSQVQGPASSSQTFTNPLLRVGPDPWVTEHDGFYYYMNTTGSNLTIWKTRSIPNLRRAQRKVVWTPTPNQPFSKQVWAPELHFLRGKWYIYFAADAGSNNDHRLWVIENSSPDPLTGTWTEPRKLTTPDDHWAIDATVFENKGEIFLVWSGWKRSHNGEQSLYIAGMPDPMTVKGPRVQISHPKLPWETIGDLPKQHPNHVNVNEGPELLQHEDKLFLTYSASGCWTDAYTLGELTASINSNLLKPSSWHKVPQPVLSTSASAHAFGPGHNTFFKSPDGKEDWIIYHANPSPGQGCGNHRSPRAQRITWRPDGTPDFGEPVPLGQPIPIPSEDPQPPTVQ